MIQYFHVLKNEKAIKMEKRLFARDINGEAGNREMRKGGGLFETMTINFMCQLD